MDSMMVLGSNSLLFERNGKPGSHRFLSSNFPVPVLGNEKTSQVGFCSLPSLRSNCSFSAWRRGWTQSQVHLNHGVLRSRKVTRNCVSRPRTAETESTTREGERIKDYEINGELVLEKDFWMGPQISLELVSSDQVDPDTGFGKTAGQLSYLSRWHNTIKLKWNSALGFPGAFRIKNMHSKEFLLKSLTINIPGQGEVCFQCNSWIFQSIDRVFFANKSFLPEETPVGLRKLRELDLESLRGDRTGERKKSDLIYDYDVYNDLGKPEESPELRRKVLGGSQDFPYPRRCRTGRPPVENAPESETRTHSIFIPPDENPRYSFDFGARLIMSVSGSVITDLRDAFKSFQEVSELYEGGLESSLFNIRQFDDMGDDIPLITFTRPQICQVDEYAWRSDKEFARQALSGLNPIVIECLQKFPVSSTLDEKMYGPQKSAITAQHIEKNLEGLSADEAIALKRLFIVDYYDAYMPYVEHINKLSNDVKTYASRTVYFLTQEGTLMPVAIELCLPPIDDNAAVRKVFIPGKDGTEEGAVWQLAKAHAKVNDAGYHQLVSHWLRTHCVTEPFIIATHRQLSKMHPVYKLLIPHYLGTMNINQAARQALISASGIIEQGFAPGRYCMEMSSKVYKQWKFNEQGLEADLLKRGMAVRDSKEPKGLKLVIEDYPYAVDGIEIWFALKQWVLDYLSLYYKDDTSVKRDNELQAWWDDIVNEGHGDLKDDPSRWYKMDSVDEAVQIVTTIIWTASAHHAAVNFGQYSYGGYMPNLPTMSRRLIPEKGTAEYEELLKNPDGFFLKTVSSPKQATLVMGVLEVLSKHAKNEVYVGQLQGSTMDRVDDPRVKEAFTRFSENMKKIEESITEKNNNCEHYKNRAGPAKVPYNLLYPNTSNLLESGRLTGGGVPNSISI
ncbi:hypothetical protein SUGI_0016920 [Cryptomeria japonica]|uniref:linoleate 9S-lipoxygenase n=1 Tax=Cryptomeria japonica TaxID=3369 RepID=UPI002408C5AA|nr:linoleate 9S-lipoxygenase [Cryptomeria japonica]GLJ05365.1 hypothetical protein SUGI_0016920 [Cryptomeria japonica]